MKTFKLHQTVAINPWKEEDSRPVRIGIIVGFCAIGTDMVPQYAVSLEGGKGFYSPDRDLFVSTVLVHPDNLEAVEEA